MLRRTVALLVGVGLMMAIGAVEVGAAAPRPTAQPYDDILEMAIDDIQEFWAEQLPAVYGVRYDRLSDRQIHAYTSISRHATTRARSSIATTRTSSRTTATWCAASTTGTATSRSRC